MNPKRVDDWSQQGDPVERPGGCRRDFLKKAGALSAALAVSQSAGEAAAAPVEEPKLPQIRLGRYSVSRLICGTNPFNGGSHLSTFVNHSMKEYYTPEQIMKTLRRCQEVGINCWQTGPGNIDLYRRFVDEGGQMHHIAIAAGDSAGIEKLVQGGCIAIAHHGERTDRMFKDGQIDQMHDYLKHVRDAGLLVGVSTHMPDVVDTVESKGWDVDYYMTCVYERHRSTEALEELLGQAPIPVGEVYLPNDPPRMFKAIRQTERPCLAFKILAAGRLSERPHWVEQAFRQTLEAIKPSDGIILGIYDRYTDQPADAAAMVRKFSSADTLAQGDS
ncbi:MAG: twin-arginine translocation signal domain-containing protein [Planctomycetota bacterium]|jgi:hypothetical protein